jgi:hypothetical protein
VRPPPFVTSTTDTGTGRCEREQNLRAGLLKMRSPPNPTGKGGFKKGQSGNPGGRPKELREIQTLAREYGVAAIKALASIAEGGKSESARIAAATALLDRGFGRCHVQHPDEITPPSQLPLLQVIFTEGVVPNDTCAFPKMLPYNKQTKRPSPVRRGVQ